MIAIIIIIIIIILIIIDDRRLEIDVCPRFALEDSSMTADFDDPS